MNAETTEPTLLIADDNPGVRRVLVQVLASFGMRTVTASDGEQALESARRLRPDLIILDVRMPGRDGHQVCAALREDDLTRHIPVLMLTGMGEREAEFNGIGTGADGYLGKPFDFGELESRVRGLLGRKDR
jgi:DNA-binding response OmpR family regulator